MMPSPDGGRAAVGPALANPAKERMRRGEVALGLIVRLARSAEMVRIAEATGHDVLVVDTQHALFALETIGDIAQAALGSGITVLVRVRSCQDPDIPRLLDAGVGGIVVPDVGTRAQAERAVAAARFAPVGRRSMPGPFASLGYRRLPAHEASGRLDDATLLVCMVETREGVENAAEIASVPGVDLVHVGCVDLSHDLGPENPVGHPSVTEAALGVIGAACRAGKLAGVGGDWDPERQAAYIRAGARYLTTQTDVGLLLEAAGRVTDRLRGVVEIGRPEVPTRPDRPPSPWDHVETRLEAHFGDRVVTCFSERPRSVHDLLAEAVRRYPDREALVDADERLTWREVERRVAALGGALRARGVGPGDRVALLLGNGNAFVLSIFAIARIGAVAVPLGTRGQRPENAFALANCGATVLIGDPAFADRIPDRGEVPTLARRVSLGEDGDAEPFAALLSGPPCEAVPVSEEDTAAILYTSGTTGRPKGAMLSHLGIVHSATVYCHCMRLGPDDRCVNGVPLSHVTGLVASVAAMARCGGALVIMPEFRASAFLPLASRERMTYTLMVPAMYNLCLLQPDLADHDLSAWRVGGFGGAPMPPATIAAVAERLPGVTLMNVYGSTETTSPVTLMPPGLIGAHGDSVGVAAPGAELIVVDEAGREVPPGEVGEIWLRSASVVRGYWDNPAATASELTGGFWHSGDLGTLDPDGFLRVLDRKKDMLNRGGHKIYTAEVEAVLASHPAVIESAVVGRPCPVLGERVHAVVVVRDRAVSAEGIRSFCAARLSDYKVPETLDLGLEPLPRNSNGKILKRELRERVAGASS